LYRNYPENSISADNVTNIRQKPIITLPGISLVALLSNSVAAREQPASKGECAHSWNKEHEYGAHFDKYMQALH